MQQMRFQIIIVLLRKRHTSISDGKTQANIGFSIYKCMVFEQKPKTIFADFYTSLELSIF